MPTYRKKNIARARELRKNQTPYEAKLWQILRAHRMEGFGWRRQYPIDNYFADFACVEAKLVVELDGASHDGRAKYDQNRDGVLRELGWRVLRVSNQELMRAPNDVWLSISGFLSGEILLQQ